MNGMWMSVGVCPYQTTYTYIDKQVHVFRECGGSKGIVDVSIIIHWGIWIYLTNT